VPSRPAAPVATVQSATSVRLEWAQPVTPNGNITKYIVMERRVLQTEVYVGMPGAVLQTTVDTLIPDTVG